MIERMTTDTIIEMVNKYADGKKYLEIGVYRGGLISQIKSKFSLGIDNFSQFDPNGDNKEAVIKNIESKNIKLIDSDCFDDKIMGKVFLFAPFDVFMYDGHHGLKQTRDAILRYHSFMADEYFLILDDWNEASVRDGAYVALSIMQKELIEEHFTNKNGSPDYWNGVAVFKVEK